MSIAHKVGAESRQILHHFGQGYSFFSKKWRCERERLKPPRQNCWPELGVGPVNVRDGKGLGRKLEKWEKELRTIPEQKMIQGN